MHSFFQFIYLFSFIGSCFVFRYQIIDMKLRLLTLFLLSCYDFSSTTRVLTIGLMFYIDSVQINILEIK